MNYSNSQRAGVILYLTALLFGAYFEIEDPADEKEDVIKFTNFKSKMWIECEIDDENNILILNLKSIARLYNESTRVEPFRTYEDLNKVLDYFKDNELYHHWFTSCLMVSLWQTCRGYYDIKMGRFVPSKWRI